MAKMSRTILTLTVTSVALDLTNKSVLLPTHLFVKISPTPKSMTSIHTKLLPQNVLGENYKLDKMYGLENWRSTCLKDVRACMLIEIGSLHATTG